MAGSSEFEEEVQKILDRERWQGHTCGLVDGALNVLYLMELPKEKRLEYLQKAAGLSKATATTFLKPREIEERIYKHKELSYEDKEKLDELMGNKALQDEKVLDHPQEVLRFLASMEGNRFIEERLPQVDQWVENGEEVTVLKVREWLIEKYNLF